MKANATESEELEEILNKLQDVQELASELNKLKIELNSKINKIKGKRGRFTDTNNGERLKLEGTHKRKSTGTLNNIVGEEALVKYRGKIDTIRSKSKEISTNSLIEEKELLKTSEKTRVYLTEKPSGKLKKGDKVRVINHYRGKYGDLFGKIGIIHEVGKSFIFIKIPNIPVLQQRTEANLQLIAD